MGYDIYYEHKNHKQMKQGPACPPTAAEDRGTPFVNPKGTRNRVPSTSVLSRRVSSKSLLLSSLNFPGFPRLSESNSLTTTKQKCARIADTFKNFRTHFTKQVQKPDLYTVLIFNFSGEGRNTICKYWNLWYSDVTASQSARSTGRGIFWDEHDFLEGLSLTQLNFC